MIFAHDTEVALSAAAALVNTARNDVGVPFEALPDVSALDDFVHTWGWTGSRTSDDTELRAVRQLRPRLAQLWFAHVRSEEQHV